VICGIRFASLVSIVSFAVLNGNFGLIFGYSGNGLPLFTAFEAKNYVGTCSIGQFIHIGFRFWLDGIAR